MSEGHPVFAVAYGVVGRIAERAGLAERRRLLLADVGGTVVEIGAGTGLLLAEAGKGFPDGRVLTGKNRCGVQRCVDGTGLAL